MIMVQYSFDHYQAWDGWSEWNCPGCDLRIGRWSQKELVKGEVEPNNLRFNQLIN